MRDFCHVDPASKSLLRSATPGEQLQMSARAYHRTRSVKLARTIADLAWAERIETVHPSFHSGQAWRRRYSIGRGERNRRARAPKRKPGQTPKD